MGLTVLLSYNLNAKPRDLGLVQENVNLPGNRKWKASFFCRARYIYKLFSLTYTDQKIELLKGTVDKILQLSDCRQNTSIKGL